MNGDKTRKRWCNNPEPQFGGKDCTGDDAECDRCNLEPCPSKCEAETPTPVVELQPVEAPFEAPIEAPDA